MAEPHAANLENGPRHGKPASSSIGSLFEFLFRLFDHSPPWLKTVIVLGIFTAVGLGVYRWISSQSANSKPNYSKNEGIPQGPYPVSNGRQIDAPNNANDDPINQVATKQISDDDAHSTWHNLHESHQPEWTIISMTDADNFVKYKFYKDTDRCVLIYRRENGQDLPPKWIRDPVFAKSTENDPPSVQESDGNLAGLLVGVAHADPQDSPHFRSEPPLQSVQVGCVNPHPGAFQWWWGPATDQCWSPMYRKFGDGCTHHQMFNRCYNAWDPAIYWDFCTGAPQHY